MWERAEIQSSCWEEMTVEPSAVLCLATQSCPTLCDLKDCILPGSSVHGDSPGQNTGVGFHALLQGIFPTQGSNPGLPHCRQILYHLSHQGSPWMLEWVAYLFSRRSSWPRNQTQVSCIASGFFTSWTGPGGKSKRKLLKIPHLSQNPGCTVLYDKQLRVFSEWGSLRWQKRIHPRNSKNLAAPTCPYCSICHSLLCSSLNSKPSELHS